MYYRFLFSYDEIDTHNRDRSPRSAGSRILKTKVLKCCYG